MKTLKMFALSAAAVLCLGLAQAHAAECTAPPAEEGTRVVNAAAPAAPQASALGTHGALAGEGAPLSQKPQMEGVTDTFLAAIGGGDGPGFQIVCVDNGCWSCCWAPFGGWQCALVC